MTLKLQVALPVGMGLLLCSCVISHSDEEYKNFVKQEVEKIRSEQILLEKQKQANQSEQIALARQKEQLKQEYQVLLQEKEKMKQERIALSQLKKQLDSEKKQQETNYENRSCHDQKDCGGINSGYFCNSNGRHTPNKCEKTNAESIILNGQKFYYNKLPNLKSWCREAFESQEDRNNPGNCNWGYLSYDAANAWCSSIGKRLVNAKEIEQNCSQFSFLPKANPDQQYWTENLSVVHMGQECSIQKMVRGDGYAWAGGVICK